MLNKIILVILLLHIVCYCLIVTQQKNSIFLLYKQDETVRQSKSQEICKYLNISVDPCDDFYEYACSNWQKYHGKSHQNKTITPDTILEEKINKDLQNMLKENLTVKDSTGGRKVKIFYKSCLEAKHNDINHQLFISDFIKSNGGFPAVPGSNWLVHHHNYDWQQVIGLLRHRYGMNILVGLDIDVNYENVYENSIYLMEPKTLFPAKLCNANASRYLDINDPDYEAIEVEVEENLKLWLSLTKNEAQRLSADIVDFEYELCKAMNVEINENYTTTTTSSSNHRNREVPKQYPRETLIKFSNLLNNSIDFNRIVTESYGVPIYKPVFMRAPQYYEQLISVLKKHNYATIANYIMYRALSELNFPIHDNTEKRPFYCVQLIKRYFPKILGEMYYRLHANIMEKEEIETLYEKLKNTFDHISLENEWIEDSTRRLGKSKLSKINLYFPTYEKVPNLPYEFINNNYWHNLKLAMSEVKDYQLNRIFEIGIPSPKDEIESYEIRTVYRPYHKRLDIGWGLLQLPHYNHHLPNAMRYAIIGQKLAEALINAFDEYGWTADYGGYNNWDTITASKFYERSNCFRQQIGNYLQNDFNSFNDTKKLRELIGKSSAVRIAFNSYLDWLHYKNPNNDHSILRKETLPELNFTNTQLFFITFAQLHCKSKRKTRENKSKNFHFARLLSPLQRHSLERYEVNGPLKNFEEFSREFKCPNGSEMNEADKCIIY
uniref:Peptidase M13 N-terminal domain-containing protein n=1 Tax=Glossina brevipalpis TaxID=37001 RepID=A0A1A9W1A7_9MUSC